MPDLDEMVRKLREELDAETAEAERRHEEIVAELRRSRIEREGEVLVADHNTNNDNDRR